MQELFYSKLFSWKRIARAPAQPFCNFQSSWCFPARCFWPYQWPAHDFIRNFGHFSARFSPRPIYYRPHLLFHYIWYIQYCFPSPLKRNESQVKFISSHFYETYTNKQNKIHAHTYARPTLILINAGSPPHASTCKHTMVCSIEKIEKERMIPIAYHAPSGKSKEFCPPSQSPKACINPGYPIFHPSHTGWEAKCFFSPCRVAAQARTEQNASQVSKISLIASL